MQIDLEFPFSIYGEGGRKSGVRATITPLLVGDKASVEIRIDELNGDPERGDGDWGKAGLIYLDMRLCARLAELLPLAAADATAMAVAENERWTQEFVESSAQLEEPQRTETSSSERSSRSESSPPAEPSGSSSSPTPTEP